MSTHPLKKDMANDIKEAMKTKALYAYPEHSLAYPYISEFEYPWQALSSISQIILEIGNGLSSEEYDKVGDNIWIAKSAKIAPSAYIGGPCIIGKAAEVRHCAFIRGSAIVGDGAVVGNSTELKNCILFDGVQVPHYNYVGDSILGYKAHMGAGSVTSNVKSDKTPVVVHASCESIDTGFKKFGAMLGDYVEVGCNSVLNPGTVIGAGSNIYPLSSVRGFVPPNCIHKTRDNIVQKRKA